MNEPTNPGTQFKPFSIMFDRDWFGDKPYTLYFLNIQYDNKTISQNEFFNNLKIGTILNTTDSELIVLKYYGNQWWRRLLNRVGIKVRTNQLKCLIKDK